MERNDTVPLLLLYFSGYLFDETGQPFEAMLIFGIIQALGGVFLMLIPIVQKLTADSVPHIQVTQEEGPEES